MTRLEELKNDLLMQKDMLFALENKLEVTIEERDSSLRRIDVDSLIMQIALI